MSCKAMLTLTLQSLASSQAMVTCCSVSEIFGTTLEVSGRRGMKSYQAHSRVSLLRLQALIWTRRQAWRHCPCLNALMRSPNPNLPCPDLKCLVPTHCPLQVCQQCSHRCLDQSPCNLMQTQQACLLRAGSDANGVSELQAQQHMSSNTASTKSTPNITEDHMAPASPAQASKHSSARGSDGAPSTISADFFR